MGLSAPRSNFANKTPLVTKIGRKALHGTTFYNGALVALDAATRYLKPNTGAAGDIIVGCADLKNHPSVLADASVDGNPIQSLLWLGIDVITGIFPFAIGGSGDALAQTDVGNNVYGIDDTTVGKTDGGTGRPIAGTLVELETLGGVAIAWVAVATYLGGAGAAALGGGTVDAVTTGAVSVGTSVTELTISGTKAFTIAAPLFVGQRKTIVCVAATSTPIGTLTSPNSHGWTTISGLGALGACIRLVGTANGWDIDGGLLVTVA